MACRFVSPFFAAAVLIAAAGSTPGSANDEAWLSTFDVSHPLVGRIWSTRNEAFVTPDVVFDRAAAADFVLLGEVHPNADHHRLQARTIEALSADGRARAVVLEMVTTDLADDLAGYISENPSDMSGLGAALRWEERGWPDWSIYRPIAEAAVTAGYEMAAGDLPPDRLMAIGTGGLDAIAVGERRRLGLDRALTDDLAAALTVELVASHCHLLPESALGGMAAVQRVRDAMLADAMIASAGPGGAILIAGGGHVREDRGVPWYLRARRPDAEIVTIAFVEAHGGAADPGDYVDRAPDGSAAVDFLWFTPRARDVDDCALLKERLEGAHGGD